MSLATLSENTSLLQSFCLHCDEAFTPSHSQSDFCCSGCETVFSLLRQANQLDYYRLKKTAQKWAKPHLKNQSLESFYYLDDLPQVGSKKMDFYLEGIHCSACIWLIENLPRFYPQVHSARLNLSQSTVSVELTPEGSFAQAALWLQKLGYKPHPIQNRSELADLNKKQNRSYLKKIGVAAACSGNIMLLAISVYGGAESALAYRFEWLSFFLALPVFFYSSIPFFQNAWNSLKVKTLSIDLPVVLAITYSMAISTYSLFRPELKLGVFFDSMTMFVFLLLSSRYFLHRLQQNLMDTSKLLTLLFPALVLRWDEKNQIFNKTPLNQIKKADLIQVQSGEHVPCDGWIKKSNATISLAVLTGESTPRQAYSSEWIEAGTLCDSGNLEIEVASTPQESRVGQLMTKIESGYFNRSKIHLVSDRIAQVFLGLVFLTSLGLVLYFWSTNPVEGFKRGLALLILACPCALAIGIPLSYALSLKKALKMGILIKNAETLERILKIKKIFLDKTGTITQGRLTVSEIKHLRIVNDFSPLTLLYCLEKKSQHPIARAIVKHLDPQKQNYEIKDFKEIPGQGVEAQWNGHRYFVRAMKDTQQTAVGLYQEDTLLLSVSLEDSLREDAAKSILKLKKMSLGTHLLTGDQKPIAQKTGSAVGLTPEFIQSEMQPEDKLKVIQNNNPCFMVGDGINDAPSLTAASVGVAVQGSLEVSLRAASVYLTQPGLTPLIQLIQIAQKTRQTLKINITLTVFYNLIGAGLAIGGWIHPLGAAILMPLSSAVVILSSVLGVKK